jgi:dimethylargininase
VTFTRHWHAITRDLSPAITRCELTHLARIPIDYARAVAQHEAYVALLQSLGISLTRLPAEADLPDAVFVEDTAIVVNEAAVITRPGAESRRAETASVAAALRPYRAVAEMKGPGTIDGGDVLRLGRTLYVGLSTRSTAEGAEELRSMLAGNAYEVRTLSVTGCLHLKSAATAVNDELVLANPAWCDPRAFRAAKIIEVDPSEPFAANVLRLEQGVIMGAGFPRTAERLQAQGITVHTVDLSELAKAEGAVTCCSLIFPV